MFKSFFGNSQADRAPAQLSNELEQPRESEGDTLELDSRLNLLQEEIENKDEQLRENDHSLQILTEDLVKETEARRISERKVGRLQFLMREKEAALKREMTLESWKNDQIIARLEASLKSVVRQLSNENLLRRSGVVLSRWDEKEESDPRHELIERTRQFSLAETQLREIVNGLQGRIRPLEMRLQRAESSLPPLRRLLDGIQRELTCWICMDLCWEPFA